MSLLVQYEIERQHHTNGGDTLIKFQPLINGMYHIEDIVDIFNNYANRLRDILRHNDNTTELQLCVYLHGQWSTITRLQDYRTVRASIGVIYNEYYRNRLDGDEEFEAFTIIRHDYNL